MHAASHWVPDSPRNLSRPTYRLDSRPRRTIDQSALQKLSQTSNHVKDHTLVCRWQEGQRLPSQEGIGRQGQEARGSQEVSRRRRHHQEGSYRKQWKGGVD